MIFVLFAGLVAGAAHVITGPDHLAALAPIAVDSPKRATRLGFMWGFGHGIGVVLLGVLGLVTSSWLDLALLSAWAEFIVGFALIVVGVWALKRASSIIIHTHAHDHDNDNDGHSHYHLHTSDQNHDEVAHRGHSHAAFAVGMFHGAAGTGHLLGVLPSLALPAEEAVVYLTAYLVAAVLSMAGFGAVLGKMIKKQGIVQLRRVMFGVAGLAVAIGTAWVGYAWPV